MNTFSEKMKWLYTFTLLLVTLAWAGYSVVIVRAGLLAPTPINVIEAAGTGTVLGILLTLNVNVNQHWFRKRAPKD